MDHFQFERKYPEMGQSNQNTSAVPRKLTVNKIVPDGKGGTTTVIEEADYMETGGVGGQYGTPHN